MRDVPVRRAQARALHDCTLERGLQLPSRRVAVSTACRGMPEIRAGAGHGLTRRLLAGISWARGVACVRTRWIFCRRTSRRARLAGHLDSLVVRHSAASTTQGARLRCSHHTRCSFRVGRSIGESCSHCFPTSWNQRERLFVLAVQAGEQISASKCRSRRVDSAGSVPHDAGTRSPFPVAQDRHG
jgi:hypothetical protein